MWDERYSGEDYAYGRDPNDFLLDAWQRIPLRGRVLCLAEGEGRNAVFLAQQGFQVVAVDSSPVGLDKARKLARENGVEIETVVADLGDFRIEPDSWDAVISIFCHIPPDVRRRLHQQVVRGLRSGGVFILEAYTPAQLAFKTGGPALAELTMQLVDIEKEIEGLDVRWAAELERDVVEGEFHTGKGAVAQLIAVKPGT